jgi:hypothetical protein
VTDGPPRRRYMVPIVSALLFMLAVLLVMLTVPGGCQHTSGGEGTVIASATASESDGEDSDYTGGDGGGDGGGRGGGSGGQGG